MKHKTKSILDKRDDDHTQLLNNLTVLIVDDEPMIRTLVKREFSNYGCQVIEAENALDAAFILEERKIDVVISDVRMEGGDGDELLKIIGPHETRRDKGPVVIMMSGYSVLTSDQAEKYGADALLQKPLSVKLLPAFVSRFLRARLAPEASR